MLFEGLNQIKSLPYLISPNSCPLLLEYIPTSKSLKLPGLLYFAFHASAFLPFFCSLDSKAHSHCRALLLVLCGVCVCVSGVEGEWVGGVGLSLEKDN